jgi:iron-sulfur cluster assembly protein
MIKITPQAQEYIKIFLKDKGRSLLAVDVIKGGCSGMQFKFFYVDSIEKGDEKFPFPDFDLIVKPHALLFTIGTELDFEKTPTGAKLFFRNANAKHTCGCGKSFNY